MRILDERYVRYTVSARLFIPVMLPNIALEKLTKRQRRSNGDMGDIAEHL